MKAKFLALAPYDVNILNAIIDATLLDLCDIRIIGDKERLIMLCLRNSINYDLLSIYNEKGDINICLRAEEIIDETGHNYIIQGNIPDYILDEFLESYDDYIVSNIIFVGIQEKQDYFCLCYPQTHTFAIQNYVSSLISTRKLLNTLGIKNYKEYLLADDTLPTIKIENELIKEHLLANENITVEIILYDELMNMIEESDNLKSHFLLLIRNKKTYKEIIDRFALCGSLKHSAQSVTAQNIIIPPNSYASSADVLFSIFLVTKLLKK